MIERTRQWWEAIQRRGTRMATLPPPSSRDPDIVDSAMKATRALSKADAVLMRRRSLNLELTRAEDLVREFRGSRPVR